MKKELPFYLLVAFILTLLIGSYSNHFHNPFQFDDAHTIASNNAIRSLKNIPTFFKDARTTSSLPANQMYRPGLTTLNAIDYWIGGKPEPDPFYFHISIFISYVLLGILLYFLFLKLFNQTIEHRWNKYIALFGAGFYSLHAANAETVNYVIARSDSFSTLMIILALVIYLYKPTWRNKYIYLIPVLIGFFVKEPTIMVAPLLLLHSILIDKKISIPKIFTSNGMKELFSSLLKFSALFILVFLLFALYKKMTPDTFVIGTISRFDYIITQPFVIVHYVNNFILPINLSADTDWGPISNIMDTGVLLGFVFLITFVIAAIYCSTIQLLRPVSFGIIWFLLALLPTSVMPLAEILNDHRTFFPYIGLAIASAWLLGLLFIKLEERIMRSKEFKWALLAIPIFVLTAHSYGTMQRNKVWSSGESLWYDVTIKSPNNGRGLMNYGVSKMEKGEYAIANDCFERALKLLPTYSYLYVNLAISKGASGEKEEAEMNFKKALSLDSGNPESFYFYANWLKSQKRYQEALDLVKNGLKVSSEHLGNSRLYSELTQLVNNNGDLTAVAEQNAKANPTAGNYLNLSLNYYQNGNFEKCIKAANQAIKLKPNFVEAYTNICSAQSILGNYEEAILAGQKAITINPDYQLAKNNLADAITKKEKVDSIYNLIRKKPSADYFIDLSLTYYNFGAYQKSADAATSALKYNPNSDLAYNNLCSAYNMLKQWDKAIEAGEKGLKINPNYDLLKNNLKASKKAKTGQ